MKNKGFTLVELVAVILILGILAAAALPRFIDLSGDAEQSTASSIAGALGSASVMNASKWQVSERHAGVAVSGTSSATLCDPVVSLLDDALPTGYTVSVLSACNAGAGACQVTSPRGLSATALISCTG